jgi:hypothetical protein
VIPAFYLMRPRFIEDAALGVAILATVVFMLGSIRVPLLLVAFTGNTISSLANVVWFATLAGFVVLGGAKSKPGFALAPLMFAVVWFGASVATRSWLQASIDPKVWSTPVSPEASAQRTLIMDSYQSIDRKIIVDGHIDKLIKLQHDNSTHKLVGVVEISTAEGDACSAEDKRNSPEFGNAGRPDACFKWRDVGEIPDGLVIETIDRPAVVNGISRCCRETQARLRRGNEERLLFSWFQGDAQVPAYFPQLALLAEPTRLWEPGTRVMQTVRYGADDIAPSTMVNAIYHVLPDYSRDNGWQPRSAPLTSEEALDRAQSLSKLPNVSLQAIASLLITARDKGIVDARSIDLATSLVGHDTEGWIALLHYASGLTSDQTEALLEDIFRRLETPNVCANCVMSGKFSGRWESLKGRLSHPDQAFERAKLIFGKRSDLADWQYEGSLWIIMSVGPQGYPASESFLHRAIPPMLFADDTPSYSDKAIAYLRVDSQFVQPNNLHERAAEKLDLVSDQQLQEYISGVWGRDSLSTMRARGAPPGRSAQADKICARIAHIADPELKKQTSRWIAREASNAGRTPEFRDQDEHDCFAAP